jgi:hypothetical protein
MLRPDFACEAKADLLFAEEPVDLARLIDGCQHGSEALRHQTRCFAHASIEGNAR